MSKTKDQIAEAYRTGVNEGIEDMRETATDAHRACCPNFCLDENYCTEKKTECASLCPYMNEFNEYIKENL